MIDEIRGYQEDEEALIDFTARNSEKKIRDRHINSGYEDQVTFKDWTRMVLLASIYNINIKY